MNGLKIEDFIPSAVDTVGLTQVDNIMYYHALAPITLDSDPGPLLFLEIAIKVTLARRRLSG
jgi:hypothetical protein